MLIRSWTTQAGLRAWMKRHDELGHLCGYVAIPPSHPWHGKRFSQCLQGCSPKMVTLGYFQHPYWGCDHPTPDSVIKVHGGITFSQQDDDSADWVFGFDCAHCMDIVLGMPEFPGATLKTEEFVRENCESMATQLVGIQPSHRRIIIQ